MKRIYRSEKRIIAGVCGGLAEYLDIDAVWVRLFFLLLLFINGAGLIFYMAAWTIIPGKKQKRTPYLGYFLILAGSFLLLRTFLDGLWAGLLILAFIICRGAFR